MPKGFFTQTLCLLTNGQTTIADVRNALQTNKFQIVKENPPHENWCFSGESLVVAFVPEVNGYIVVDLVNRPWPDSMGDPKSDPLTFAAWSMGHFGPFTSPNGLARASEQSWAWPQGRAVAASHKGFIRLRTSYVLGAPKNAPTIPKDCDPLAELVFISRAALAILQAPGVLCYFNPNGEVLRDLPSFTQIWEDCTRETKVPLSLWSNIRIFNINEKLCLMDTIGNDQLDIPDIEAAFPKSRFEPATIDSYLHGLTFYLLCQDQKIRTGETLDGPGEESQKWMTEVLEKGITPPRRPALRIYPKSYRNVVMSTLASATGAK